MPRQCITHHYACDCREAKFAKSLEDAYRAGFIEACDWTEPVIQDMESLGFERAKQAWIKKYNAEGG